MKLVPGKYYTVKKGRFKGITCIAVEPVAYEEVHVLRSIDFPDGGIRSFLNSLSHLRAATAKEELAYRRRDDRGDS